MASESIVFLCVYNGLHVSVSFQWDGLFTWPPWGGYLILTFTIIWTIMPKSMFVCMGLHVPLLALPPPSPGELVAGCCKTPALSTHSFTISTLNLLYLLAFLLTALGGHYSVMTHFSWGESQNFCFVRRKSPPKVVSLVDPTFRHK